MVGCLSRQCPNLIVLVRAEGHDRPAYINSLSRLSVKVGESRPLCLQGLTGTFMDGRAIVLPHICIRHRSLFTTIPPAMKGFFSHVLGA